MTTGRGALRGRPGRCFTPSAWYCLPMGTMSAEYYRTYFAERPLYRIWVTMKRRCDNPRSRNYENYGGRSIGVCERWKTSYEAFESDMGPRPGAGYSIDRIDSDGPYSPENCKWATTVEQARNKRTNHVLTYDGKSQPISAWAEELGLDDHLIAARIVKHGWDVERALTTPPRTYARRQPRDSARNDHTSEGRPS